MNTNNKSKIVIGFVADIRRNHNSTRVGVIVDGASHGTTEWERWAYEAAAIAFTRKTPLRIYLKDPSKKATGDNIEQVDVVDTSPPTSYFNRAPRFPRQAKSTSLPAALAGCWKLGNFQYEIKSNGKYYALTSSVDVELQANGSKLDYGGTEYTRESGASNEFVGTWALSSDNTEKWTLNADGTYVYEFPGYTYEGFYSVANDKMDSGEMRAILTENSSTLTFSPPYGTTVSGPWSITNKELTIELPSGTLVYTEC